LLAAAVTVLSSLDAAAVLLTPLYARRGAGDRGALGIRLAMS
jgi:hypothetical protein